MQTRISMPNVILPLCITVVMLLPSFVNAQFVVKGKITDQLNNEPLAGVTVTLKGTERATSTNATGDYTISLPTGKGRLVFSNVGYSNQEVAVGNKHEVNVKLEGVTTSLNEVVVVGYGTQRKRDLTGAVSQVKATQLENENPGNVQDVLRGNVPGLNI